MKTPIPFVLPGRFKNHEWLSGKKEIYRRTHRNPAVNGSTGIEQGDARFHCR